MDDPWDSCFLNAGLLDGPSEDILTNYNGLIEDNVIPRATNVPSGFASQFLHRWKSSAFAR